MDGNSARILLIEDNSGDALLITEMLSEFPGRYEVTRANRFSAAFELLERIGFDLVIMDLNLPDGNGIESMGRIREKSALPVIVMTGFFDERLAARAVAEGAGSFIVKGNVDAVELDATIQKCLKKKDHS